MKSPIAQFLIVAALMLIVSMLVANHPYQPI
jgi:hypothetical protein